MSIVRWYVLQANELAQYTLVRMIITKTKMPSARKMLRAPTALYFNMFIGIIFMNMNRRNEQHWQKCQYH